MIDKSTNSFWKAWRKLYNKNKSHLPPVVDGLSSPEAIAESFKNSFQRNSMPNSVENVERVNQKFISQYSEYVENHKDTCNCADYHVTPSNIIDALCSMKEGKSADEDRISAEHLQNAPLEMINRLASLFNMMLRHACVPKQFKFGYIVPLVKDHGGNHGDIGNYRGITISPIMSKLFEHVLKGVFFDFLSTSEHQFGFKRNSSTSHALHCLKQTVNFYVNNGSRVYCTFLDASKAFDRLVHSGLFIKLMERRVPLVFLNIIIDWYDGLRCRVKWGDYFSSWFSINAGVRQGGVLSPNFYCIYVDELLAKLKKLDKGCYYLSRFAAAFFYADDMCVLSPSIKGLELLIKTCEKYCIEWDIGLNAKKSRSLYFGKSTSIEHEILLNGKKVEWADQWVYLGVTLRSNKCFDCTVTDRIKKYYRCVNSILRIEGHSNETVMLQLLETHCVPILTYAVEIIHIANRDERRQLRVAYNCIFRKVFGYRWSQSVTCLQAFLGKPTWEQLLERKQNKFFSRIRADSDSLAYILLQ